MKQSEDLEKVVRRLLRCKHGYSGSNSEIFTHLNPSSSDTTLERETKHQFREEEYPFRYKQKDLPCYVVPVLYVPKGTLPPTDLDGNLYEVPKNLSCPIGELRRVRGPKNIPTNKYSTSTGHKCNERLNFDKHLYSSYDAHPSRNSFKNGRGVLKNNGKCSETCEHCSNKVSRKKCYSTESKKSKYSFHEDYDGYLDDDCFNKDFPNKRDNYKYKYLNLNNDSYYDDDNIQNCLAPLPLSPSPSDTCFDSLRNKKSGKFHTYEYEDDFKKHGGTQQRASSDFRKVTSFERIKTKRSEEIYEEDSRIEFIKMSSKTRKSISVQVLCETNSKTTQTTMKNVDKLLVLIPDANIKNSSRNQNRVKQNCRPKGKSPDRQKFVSFDPRCIKTDDAEEENKTFSPSLFYTLLEEQEKLFYESPDPSVKSSKY